MDPLWRLMHERVTPRHIKIHLFIEARRGQKFLISYHDHDGVLSTAVAELTWR